MNLTLIRDSSGKDGVFGWVYGSGYKFIFVSLEHAYLNDDGTYSAKIPNGVYTCKRGTHQLQDGIPFETFEIQNVPGHSNILIHVGNYNDDSEGCILLGLSIGFMKNGNRMITNSLAAFKQFMDLQKNCDEFTVTIENG